VHRLLERLTGLPDAISVVRPQATLQLCLVHLTRASLQSPQKRPSRPIKDLPLSTPWSKKPPPQLRAGPG
jgi:Transposase, Mutator family